MEDSKIALDIVNDLNDYIYDKDSIEYYKPFEFRSIGSQDSIVYFMGVFIWSVDNDERDYIEETDEREPLREFLIRQAKIVLKDLNLKMSAF